MNIQKLIQDEAEKVPKVSKAVLKDIYRLHTLASKAYNNELNDARRGGPDRATIRLECYEEASKICEKYINANDPL